MAGGCGCKATGSAVGSDEILSCAGLTGMVAEGETQTLKDYMAKVGISISSDIRENWVPCYTMAALRIRRLFYGKSAGFKGLYSDCGTDAQGAPGGAVALQGITGGLGVLGSAASIGLIGGASALGAATFGIGLLALPFIAIFRHHALAVQKEQSTLCQITYAYNSFADQVEPALRDGKISLADAITQLQQLGDAIDQALAGITTTNPCNAGCGIRKTVKALILWNKEVNYPGLAQGLLGGTAGKIGLGVLVFGGGLLLAKAAL